MRVVMDLTRCQNSGQSMLLALKVFRFHGEEVLAYDSPLNSSPPGVKGRND
jgi:hypothetical protein